MPGALLSQAARSFSPSSWPCGWLRGVVVTTLVACLQTASRAWRSNASTSSEPSTSVPLPTHVWILLNFMRAQLASKLSARSCSHRTNVWVFRLMRSSVVSLACACSAAFADDCLTPSVTLTPRATTIQGAQGVFFPTEQAERLLFVTQTCLPQARRAVAAAEDLRKDALALVESSSKALALSSVTVQNQQQMLELYRTETLELRAQRDSVWSSPVLWFAIGVAATTLGTAALISALGGAQ